MNRDVADRYLYEAPPNPVALEELRRLRRISAQERSQQTGEKHSEEYFYQEHAHNMPTAESIPFIETECAYDFFVALDEAGLRLHSLEIEAEMIAVDKAESSGSVYTTISRELAKWVNRDEKICIDNLFALKTEEAKTTPYSMFDSLYDAEAAWEYGQYNMRDFDTFPKEEVKERLLSIDTTPMGEAAKTLFDLAQGALSRTDAPCEDVTELSVTNSDIRLYKGTCSDVASYYIGARDLQGLLQNVEHDGVPMLEKLHGEHTFMLQRETILNGVQLPKGTLMQRGDDGGWAMLRLTPFCFDTQNDQLVFGSELEKAKQRHGIIIRGLGGTSLKHLAKDLPPQNKYVVV